jgi:hypothetical protein
MYISNDSPLLVVACGYIPGEAPPASWMRSLKCEHANLGEGRKLRRQALPYPAQPDSGQNKASHMPCRQLRHPLSSGWGPMTRLGGGGGVSSKGPRSYSMLTYDIAQCCSIRHLGFTQQGQGSRGYRAPSFEASNGINGNYLYIRNYLNLRMVIIVKNLVCLIYPVRSTIF